MMKRKREIKAFVGLQIKSKFHSFDEIKLFFTLLSTQLDSRQITLQVTYGLFPPGRILWDEVRKGITECDVAFFDVSENNPNVMIEVGLAYGLRKQVFILKCRESFSEYPLPSDLAVIYVPYKKGRLKSPDIAAEVEKGILRYLQTPDSPDYYPKSLWGFSEYDDVLVICSELEEPEKRQHPEPNEYIYLSKYGDVDSLMEVLVTLHRVYPELKITFRSANEVATIPEQYTGNIILIGGPDYNRITGLFQEYSPYEYVEGVNEYDIRIRHKNKGTIFIPQIQEEKGLKKITDYGFFIKRKNPYNPSKKLVMIGGSHTYGVFGAIKAFSYTDMKRDELAFHNCRKVVEILGNDPDFCVLFKVNALESSVLTPELSPDHLEAL